MKQTDIVQMLRQYGFEGLHLFKAERKTFTYTFQDWDKRRLDKELGSASVAADGKVAVYKVGTTAKLGISPANSLVRVIVLIEDSRVADDSHITKIDLPPAVSKAFLQAQAKPSLRLKFCDILFDHLNKTKFSGALPKPTLKLGDSFPKMPKARGVYTGGNNFTAGGLWMANYMFNAREHFFVEVFLHEMCHLASWTISKERDHKTEGGHGPTWQGWMKKVGLDPRRYDPTDDVEYKDTGEAIREEEALSLSLGKKATLQEVRALKPLGVPFPEKCKFLYKGRIYDGGVIGVKISDKHFEGRGPNGKLYSFKVSPATTFYAP